ncbi:hypothetical protein QVE09_16190 [Paenibacillus sp. ClWae2A]|uniref:hypothetical protein n=1 Tax=Paenibacillus sp. ClWae2A TaxID=3057177 RepID=UPI0028F5E07C|nr:hypothetical protein [Paenibacillus sp. ClWae2A]MDT9720460.1 hypothetical protein [Paenibacillus sp. ClWae2A]
MSWVRMNIFNDQLSGELEMDQLGAGETKAVIEGFFGAFGLQVKDSKPEVIAPVRTLAISPPFSASDITPAAEIQTKVMASTIKSKQAVKEILKDAVIENAKRVTKPAMIHSERTLSTSLGEKLAEAYQNIDSESLNVISNSTETNEQVDDYKVTGIKYKDGVPHYKCRYWCKNPKCRAKGNLYIIPEEKTVECYDCGSVHEVREAVFADPLKRDDWGNFFIADHLA